MKQYLMLMAWVVYWLLQHVMINNIGIIYPASYPGVISVAAINHLDKKASYSNFGPQVTVCAPGGDNGHLLLSTL